MSNPREHVVSGLVEKLAFANYLPLLARATADSPEATPGYLLVEIQKLSYDYPQHCKQLVTYLSRRLGVSSVHVKLKVLKIMDNLIREGHINFRVALRSNDSAIKMATRYHAAPDPLTGTTLYETVRTNAKELLEFLFLPENIQEDEKQLNDPRPVPEKVFLGALGSTSKGDSKFQGFGNSPIVKEESVAEKVLNYFDKLSSPSDQNAKIIREGIASSVGSYEAVNIPSHQHYTVPSPSSRMLMAPDLSCLPASRVSVAKAHVPGKAGGGWEDSEEEEEDFETLVSHQRGSILSAESLEIIEVMPDNSAERELVKQFCAQDIYPVQWKELAETCAGCVKLSGSEVLRALAEELLLGSRGAGAMRALTLIDVLLHSELLATPRAVGEAQHILGSALATLNDENVPQNCRDRAEKIKLILTARAPS